MSKWKPERRPPQTYSGFPAAVVFFAMVLVAFTLIFRGHLFEGAVQARVFLPIDPAAVALVRQGDCPVAACVASLPR
ncbi:hypothetical protein ACC719_11330 [Rhizobium ruizarguesonis]